MFYREIYWPSTRVNVSSSTHIHIHIQAITTDMWPKLHVINNSTCVWVRDAVERCGPAGHTATDDGRSDAQNLIYNDFRSSGLLMKIGLL